MGFEPIITMFKIVVLSDVTLQLTIITEEYFAESEVVKLPRRVSTGTKIRTRNSGFGDRYDTISPYLCVYQYVKDPFFVPPVRLELTTPWLKATYSSQLSYKGISSPSSLEGGYRFRLCVFCFMFLFWWYP